ncbi:MAG: MCE family protein [Halioglobus sp.]|nr:MCE family protein [Halioglobus sp.]
MSEQPHSVAIGAFVAGALLIALTTFGFLIGSGFGGKEKVIMAFDGSVTGLNVGAPVALRGVQVGQVTKIEAVLDSANLELVMLVEAEFDPDAIRIRGTVNDDLTEELLARGLRAQLNTQSLLTGLLYIQLDFHPDSELKLADIDSPYFQFPTIPTDLERITKTLQDIDVAALAEQLTEMVDNVNALVSNDDFQTLPESTRSALQSFTTLSDQLQTQLTSSGPKLDKLLTDAALTLDSANQQLPAISRLVQKNLEILDEAIGAFEDTLRGVESLVSYDSPTLYELNKALQELTRAGRSLQSLANTLEDNPEALLRGRRGDDP